MAGTHQRDAAALDSRRQALTLPKFSFGPEPFSSLSPSWSEQVHEGGPIEGITFLAFNHAVERSDGAIPRKYRELIALRVAFTTQCAYCIDTHTRQARGAGVTTEEIAEAAFVAAAVRAGGALAHALLSLRLHESPQK